MNAKNATETPSNVSNLHTRRFNAGFEAFTKSGKALLIRQADISNPLGCTKLITELFHFEFKLVNTSLYMYDVYYHYRTKLEKKNKKGRIAAHVN